MISVKRFNKFLKSEQCKMIGCIFLVLLASIMIKLSMPDTFEYLNPIKFVLKFKETVPSDFKINDFDFKISLDGNDTSADEIVDKSPNGISEVKFTIETPKKDFTLEITPKQGTSPISSFKIGDQPYTKDGSSYKIPIKLDEVNKEIEMTIT